MDPSNEKMEKTNSNPKVAEFSEGEISNLDEADIFLRDNNFSPEYIQELLADKDLNKRLVRKIDLILLPLLAGTYVLQYIDKSALAYSAVFDILTDTNTSLYQYSWLGSIFYFAYLFGKSNAPEAQKPKQANSSTSRVPMVISSTEDFDGKGCGWMHHIMGKHPDDHGVLQ